MSRLRRRPQGGFSLVEAAIGLALIGVALLLTMSLMAQQPWIERRLAAHREALGLMEIVLEQYRSGVALPSGIEFGTEYEIDVSDLPRSLVVLIRQGEELVEPPPAAQDLRIWIVVDKLPRSLYEVRLTARYSVGGRPFETALESMVFSPP